MAMSRKQIREAIDACRPDSDDLQQRELAHLAEQMADDPKVRRLYEQTQRLDASVGEAYRDVPVPEGLQERLLAALGESADSVAPVEETPAVVLPSTSPTQLASRRVWLGASAAAVVTVTAAILVGAFVMQSPETPLTGQEFVDAADLFVNEAMDSGQWNLEEVAQSDRPISKAVLGTPKAFQRISTKFDSNAVVYDMTTRTGSPVMLVVVEHKGKVQGLPPTPPTTPQPATGQQTIGAWKEGNFLYALVVRGADHGKRYHRLLRAAPVVAFLARNVSPV